MSARDNWGWQARIGLFIVGSEAVPEAEWWAMAPPHVSVHAARVTSSTPWARWNADKRGVDLADDLVRGARQFAAMRLSAVVVGHTSSSLVGGAGWDHAVVATLQALVGPETWVSTNGLDCLAALQAMGVKRPFLVVPPWFGDPTLSAAVQYFTAAGISPAAHLRADPGRNWRDVPPAEMYPQGLGLAQEIEPLYAQIRAACPAEADGILIGGTGFRCAGILEALERDLARPVISANQASLWHALRRTGVRVPVEGYGRLLRS